MKPTTEPERITTSRGREELADLVNRVAYGQEQIVFTRHGRDVAVLISMDDFERLNSKSSSK